ncbi:MAG: hypothetical protein JSS81_23920 [Acidobacteria bacterium]|nr:hypothetical protein [Acidobacteriota bacterium]
MMRKIFFGLIMTLIFGGALAANAQTAQQISVRVNKQVKASRSRLTVRFVAVEDSRCPKGTECIWAGNAKVTIKVTDSKGKSQTFDLNTNLEPKSARFGGYEITLGEVTPYPAANVRIDPNGYRAKFTITRL